MAQNERKNDGQQPQAQTTAVTKPNQSLKEKIEQTVGRVYDHLTELEKLGQIVFPKDYNVGNALKAAGLHLLELVDKNGKSVYEVCKTSSIVNALMEMCMDGLSVAKKQGYLIIYGDKLHWQPDYRGNILKAKRDADVKEVNANCIYKGDEFKYEVNTATGRMKLVSHVPDFDNQDITKIKGAYAIVVFNDNTSELTVMTMDQIKRSWLQGFGGGNTKAHQNFTDRMCRKTVINRAVNNIIGASDDSSAMPEIDDDEERVNDLPLQTREAAKTEKANKKEISTEDIQYEDVTAKEPLTPADATPEPETASLSSLGAEEKDPY